MLEFSRVFHLNNTASIFPPDLRSRLIVRLRNSFQNLIILPEFCLFLSPAGRGAGVMRTEWLSLSVEKGAADIKVTNTAGSVKHY